GSVSNEWILRQNPDYFIKMFAWRNQEDATKLLTMKKQVVASIANRPGWSSLQAVKSQRIRVLESDYSGGPRYIVGLLRWPLGYTQN
ncbi:MAG: hypothetical protein LBS60_14220, partial [Deltaproteobacteria bacterium]|nr:hypothetical protein [Deltaproteobacteria bacterium]